jgi:hypothetical protein
LSSVDGNDSESADTLLEEEAARDTDVVTGGEKCRMRGEFALARRRRMILKRIPSLPPGVPVMKDKRVEVSCTFEELPTGGRVRIKTANADALIAIHAFLRFQIEDHHPGDTIEVGPDTLRIHVKKTQLRAVAKSVDHQPMCARSHWTRPLQER